MSSTAARALAEARRHRGLSQEALAEQARVSVRTIRSLESGTAKRPHRDTLLAVGTTLGLRAADLDAFVTSWRGTDRTIADLIGTDSLETKLTDEIARQRSKLRERVISCVITVDAARRWRSLTVRRTFEVTADHVDHFLNGMSLPTGQDAEVDTREYVNLELLDSLAVRGSAGRALLFGLRERALRGSEVTIGYGLTYGPVDSAESPTDDSTLFVVASAISMLSHEIRFDPSAAPTTAWLTRQDSVAGESADVAELPVSSSGIVHSVQLPVSAGVHGVRWVWPD